MSHRERSCRFFVSCAALLLILLMSLGESAIGDDRIPGPRGRVYTTRPGPVCVDADAPALGTFEPTPYIMVRGNWPTGGGYSPLETFGDQSMALYGPLSPLRTTSAPIMTYTRGYDGRITAAPATSFSTPNLPRLSPVVYPTPASYYYGPRMNRTPSGWTNSANWIDQN